LLKLNYSVFNVNAKNHPVIIKDKFLDLEKHRNYISTDLKPKIKEKKMSVEQRVKEIIMDELGVDEAAVVPGASFINDLGADSLATVELVMKFEDEFDIKIEEEDAEKITTVGSAVDFIKKQLGE